MRHLSVWLVFVSLLACCSCAEYTPKPRGYFRIEPGDANYLPLPLNDLPYTFTISGLSAVELPPIENIADSWINISYPSLGAKIYCSYLPITPSTLGMAERESRKLVERQAKYLDSVSETSYSNPDKRVYGTLFLLGDESASPIQFMLTDSVSRFFRGALYYDCKTNADSLAPVTEYIKNDILELIQSFSWKN